MGGMVCMIQPRIIIVDTDVNYVIPLQFKFVQEFFGQVELEIITEPVYFNELFSRPQKAEILIVEESLYDDALQKHNISNIFVMSEKPNLEESQQQNIIHLFKYTSIKEIFNEIVGKSGSALNVENKEENETKIVVVTSATGNVGKTTVAMGLSTCLEKHYKRVLYINASRMQSFQYILDNHTPISSSDIYAKLTNPDEQVYLDIKHIIRKEIFSYLPSFKAALLSLGISFSIYEKIALSAQKSKDYDYIVIDAESAFDEEKTRLLDIADKVIVVTGQCINEVEATNTFVSNISGVDSEKYFFVCNDFFKNNYNALIATERNVKYDVNEYVEHFDINGVLKCDELSENVDIRKIAFGVM